MSRGQHRLKLERQANRLREKLRLIERELKGREPFDLERHMRMRERQLKGCATRHELRVVHFLRVLRIAFAFQKGFSDNSNTNYGKIYIVDFYLPAPLNLILEIDGQYHEKIYQQTQDVFRDRYFAELGLRVLRVTNAEVEGMTAQGLHEILTDYHYEIDEDPARQFARYAPP